MTWCLYIRHRDTLLIVQGADMCPTAGLDMGGRSRPHLHWKSENEEQYYF
jgi:hypothetical protein